MKTTSSIFSILGAALALVAFTFLSATAAIPQPEGLIKVRAGECVFTLVDAKASEPIIAAPIALLDADSGEAVSRGETTGDGLYTCTLDEGRYVLVVARVLIAVVDVAEDYDLEAVRVIMPRQGLLIGAQDEEPLNEDEAEEETDDDVLPLWLLAGGGTVVVGGTAVVVEQNNDSGGGSGTPATGGAAPPPPSGGGGPSAPDPTPTPAPEDLPTTTPSVPTMPTVFLGNR